MKYRKKDAFGDDVKYTVIGEPVDVSSARALALLGRCTLRNFPKTGINFNGGRLSGESGCTGEGVVEQTHRTLAFNRWSVIWLDVGKMKALSFQAKHQHPPSRKNYIKAKPRSQAFFKEKGNARPFIR